MHGFHNNLRAPKLLNKTLEDTMHLFDIKQLVASRDWVPLYFALRLPCPDVGLQVQAYPGHGCNADLLLMFTVDIISAFRATEGLTDRLLLPNNR